MMKTEYSIAATEGDTFDTEAQEYGIIVGDTSKITVQNADDVKFEITSADNADIGISPRISVASGCASYIKRIVVWPAHYDATNNTIRNIEELYGYYNWGEAVDFGGTMGVPEASTQRLMEIFTKNSGYVANAWIMQTAFNIYSDYIGSYPKYYEFTPSSNCLANRNANGKVRFECNGKPGNQTVYLTANFVGTTDPANQPELLLSGGFYYFNKSTKTTQSAMSFTRTIFNQ